jgi:DNA primase
MLVVEGYMDVIACQRAGLPAVAPMGTAMTEEQMEVLWRLHPEPTLSFDGDKAGQRAAARAIDRALPLLKPGRSFKFSMVVGGKDPDDVLREQGAAALKSQLTQTTPFVEALFARERDLEPLDTPERKAGLKQRLRAAAGTIADKDLAAAYRDDLYAKLDALFPKPAFGGGGSSGSNGSWGDGGGRPFVPRGQWKGGRDRGPPDPGIRGVARAEIGTRLNPFHAAVAVAALRHPAWARPYDEAIERIGFGDPRLAPLAVELFEALADEISDDVPFRDILTRKGLGPQLAEAERVASAIPAPFLDPKMDAHRARALWSPATRPWSRSPTANAPWRPCAARPSPPARWPATRDLRTRIGVLERQISGLEFWDAPPTTVAITKFQAKRVPFPRRRPGPRSIRSLPRDRANGRRQLAVARGFDLGPGLRRGDGVIGLASRRDRPTRGFALRSPAASTPASIPSCGAQGSPRLRGCRKPRTRPVSCSRISQ